MPSFLTAEAMVATSWCQNNISNKILRNLFADLPRKLDRMIPDACSDSTQNYRDSFHFHASTGTSLVTQYDIHISSHSSLEPIV